MDDPHNLASRVTRIHGTQHYLAYTFRDKFFRLNGDYTRIDGVVYTKGVADDGSHSWADEEGNFLSENQIAQVNQLEHDISTVQLIRRITGQ